MLTILLAGAAVQSLATLQAPAMITPPVSTDTTRTSRERELLVWVPGAVRCAGDTVIAQPMQQPLTALSWAGSSTLSSLSYEFAIDAAGRTTDIRAVTGGQAAPYSDDIAPSLAATRFAIGSPRSRCSVIYMLRRTPLAEAPLSDLVAYTIIPRSGPLPQAGWDRIKSFGDCSRRPAAEPLVRVFPNFRRLPATPGVQDWSLVGYDINTDGRPTNVTSLFGTGNGALDAASVEAISESRFSGAAQVGCSYPYWRAPATLAAPSEPSADAFRSPTATCPVDPSYAEPAGDRYPPAYRRRAIEGWAVLTFDAAPWGDVGNIKVVAAQPAEDFGTAATQALRAAKLAPGNGVTGCIEVIHFRIADAGANSGEPGVEMSRTN